MRRLLATALAAFALAAACTPGDQAASAGTSMSAAQRTAIADSLKSMITSAYDLTKGGDAVGRLMSLYPDSGTIVSASGGQVTTTRADLESGVRAFWENVGRNMRDPKWTWESMHVDVLSPDAATVTATYRVPHLTPRGEPHVIAGAWTAVFARRGGRWVIVQEHLSDLPAAAAMAMPAGGSDSASGPTHDSSHAMPGMANMPGMAMPAPAPAVRRP